MYNQKIKSNSAQIIIPIIGLIIIASWAMVIVPDLKNDFSSYELIAERISESSIVENVGDPLPPNQSSRLTLHFDITGVDGNIIEVTSTFRDHDPQTDEVTWESKDVYYIDKNTRKHVNESEGYFAALPYNTQKQDYMVNHPLVGNPTMFYFEGTETIQGIEMYRYSCNDLDGDRTATYPEFAPETIHSEHTCDVLIEPITGNALGGEVTWYNYVIKDGERIPVDVGKSDTTTYAIDVRLKLIKDKIELFQFYDKVVPIFMILTTIAVFSTSVYNKKSKERGKIIEKQLDELKKADKTKTLFLNNLTHELKTPLVPITGNAEILKNPKMGELNEMQKESVNEIFEHSTRMLSTVEDFLKLQEITEGKLELHLEKVGLDEISNDLSDIVAKYENKVPITIDFEKDVSIKTKKSELINVLKELVENTIDFLPEKLPQVTISAQTKGSEILFSIKDNGQGIPKEKQGEIFKPFIKADMSQSRTHDGSGMGLPICKGILEVMKGKIWVESEEGQGSTFFFTIPKA